MKAWTRASRVFLCGRCDQPIQKGEAALEIRVVAGVFNVAKPKRRCANCAGEDVPADLPPLVERELSVIAPTLKVKKPRRHTMQEAADFKHAQAGE